MLTARAMSRFVARSCAVLLFTMAARVGWFSYNYSPDPTAAFVIFLVLVLLSIALFRARPWAMQSLAAVLVVAAVVIPFGVINPLTAGDEMAAGQVPPTVPQILRWLLPTEIALLVVAYFLDFRENNE